MKNKEEYLEGQVILIDKEKEWTSFDIVRKMKNIFHKYFKIKKIKIGHAGTLDPLASGLLIICTGKKTKQISDIQNADKEYIAKVKLGETTPSFDLETIPDMRFETEHITKEMIEDVLAGFIGEQDQFPPVFSAKKVNGKRSYEYARKGQEVDLKSSRIHIYNAELIHFDNNDLIVRVHCSKGTYIRSFANDLGIRLNSGAYLADLQRTRIGEYKLADAQNIHEFEKSIQPVQQTG